VVERKPLSQTVCMTATSRRPRGRPPGGAPVISRDELLDVAEGVIKRDGPGTSIEAIAVAAGVSKPVVYARIGDRGDVAAALAERLADRLLRAGASEVHLPPGRTALVAFVRIALDVLARHRELFLFVTREPTGGGRDQRLYLAQRSAQPIAEMIADARRQAGRDPGVALPWALGVVGMLNMVALWWLAEDERPLDELAEQLAELIWSGLGDFGHR
jgi:AcrR family transcriptional regulator